MPDFLYLPLGYRCDGRPIFGFSGGDGEGDGDGDEGDGDGGGGAAPAADSVEGLRSTLAKVVSERKEVRDEYRPWKAALRELGVQSPDQLKELLVKNSGGASGKPDTIDIEAERAKVRAEVSLEANRDIALAQVEAMAKGTFADPDDAVSHLRKSVDDLLGRDGKPDKKAIERELSDLLAAKPHWGVTKNGPASFDGGARETSGGKVTMDGWLRQRSREKRG